MPLLFALLLSISQPSLIKIPRVEAEVLTTDDYKTIATADAVRYGLNIDHFLATINCESQFNPDAKGSMGEIGIVQILPSAHKDIPIEKMKDAIWSLNWMAQKWANGEQNLWSCWTKLYD